MKNGLFIFFIGVTYAFLISAFNYQTGNLWKLTLRGRRVLFIIAFIGGLAIGYFLIHFEMNCDLRPNATTPCMVNWN